MGIIAVGIAKGAAAVAVASVAKFDFIVTGFPGTSSAFWSLVLTQSGVSHCFHEFSGHPEYKDYTMPNLVGDACSEWAYTPVRAGRVLVIDRNRDAAMDSFLRRYPSGEAKAGDLFNKMERGLKRFNTPNVLRLPYKAEWDEDTISKVFQFCTGKQIHPMRLPFLSRLRVLTFE